jgi:S1-C subfamily serine protease
MYKLLLTLALFSFFVVGTFAQNSKQQLFESCFNPTVVVFDPTNETGGSAFIVRSSPYGKKFRNALITANHTVESNGPFFVKIFKYKNFSEIDSEIVCPLYIYALEPNDDLAIGVFESDQKLPVAKINLDHKIIMGDGIFHIGFGMMDDARIDYGEITQTKTHRPEIFKGLIRTNAYSMVGDSGGPLFQKDSLKVIGVCRAIRKHNDQLMNHQSYFTDIKCLKIWNDKLDNSLEPIYTDKRELPKLPFIKMDLQKYKYKIPD